MPELIDLTGQTFGRWEVISRGKNCNNGHTKWICKCKCGTIREVRGTSLTQEKSKSCGCLQKELTKKNMTKHGQYKTRLYRIWEAMIQRTTNPNNKKYVNYGGRGICVHAEWKNDFEKFMMWAVENGYREDLTIDRKDNEKGYTPDNCRWVSTAVQNRNTRQNHYITFRGTTQTITDWAKDLGIKRNTLYDRINKYGWSIEKALTTK